MHALHYKKDRRRSTGADTEISGPDLPLADQDKVRLEQGASVGYHEYESRRAVVGCRIDLRSEGSRRAGIEGPLPSRDDRLTKNVQVKKEGKSIDVVWGLEFCLRRWLEGL